MPGPLVLYAEDDPNDVFLVQRAFLISRPDLQLRVVRDGLEALQYLSHCLDPSQAATHPKPHLVLLDISMPDCNGFDVLTWIRGREDLSSMPVIIISSSDRIEDQQKAAILGANFYIPKISTYRDLPNQVQPWLQT